MRPGYTSTRVYIGLVLIFSAVSLVIGAAIK